VALGEVVVDRRRSGVEAVLARYLRISRISSSSTVSVRVGLESGRRDLASKAASPSSA
jgi:hypothetical protein